MSFAIGSDYQEYEKAPGFQQTLWKVDHSQFGRENVRFEESHMNMYERLAEMEGGALTGAPIPKGMVKFVEHFIEKFGVLRTPLSDPRTLCGYVLECMDIIEPYELMNKMPLELTANNMTSTYRNKETGSVLDPLNTEVFIVNPNHKFEEYHQAMAVFNHPSTAKVFAGEQVWSDQSKKVVTTRDIVRHIAGIVWNGGDELEEHTFHWLQNAYSEVAFDVMQNEPEMNISESHYFQHDELFWNLGVVAAMTWIRSPYSLPYLCDFHPIYSSVLRFNHNTNKPEIEPGSGGEAIIHYWEVYSLKHLDVERHKIPGTCDNCHSALHCTVMVNARAVAHPVCSCGERVDPRDFEFYGHHGKSVRDCAPYLSEHRPIRAFGCRRCLGILMEGRTPDQPCPESPRCPNTQCSHHAGASLVIKNMNEKRRLLLADMRQA
jgi:hypothetical protein